MGIAYGYCLEPGQEPGLETKDDTYIGTAEGSVKDKVVKVTHSPLLVVIIQGKDIVVFSRI